MSNWIEVDDPEDIDIDGDDIDIFIGNDKFGNNYVTIPLSIMQEKILQYLEKHKENNNG